MTKQIIVVAIALLSVVGAWSNEREGKHHLRKRFEDARLRRVPASGVVAPDARSKAIDLARKSPSKYSESVLVDQPTWKILGPRSTAGRIKSIVCDPITTNTLYIGAASGGVWKSADGGLSWQPMMDDANAIAMGALCIAPNNTSTLYAGTGEQVVGANMFLGAGLMRSLDAGITWSVIGLPRVGSFSRVCIHPSTPSTIVAGGMNEQAGVWKSTDEGATWNRLWIGQVFDITLDEVDPNIIIAAVQDSGIIVSFNGGNTWIRSMNGLNGRVGRASVQQSKTAPSTLFALLEINDLAIIAKSTDKGLTWRVVFQDTQGCFFSGTCTPAESQGFYNNVVAINPRDANHVIAGGIDLYMTTDGGTTWRNTTQGYADGDGNGNPHVDQHALAFDPIDPNVVYAGNDGGMMRSADRGATWQVINNGLSISQFYAFDVDRKDRARVFGGTQDNGTLGTSGSVEWDSLHGGDGMTTMLDPSNSNILYGSEPNGDFFKIDLATQLSQRIVSGLDLGEDAEWVAPLLIDQTISQTLFTGRRRIYRSYNAGNSWEPVSAPFSNTVTALAQSPADDEVFWAGGSYGDVVRSTDYGTTWIPVSAPTLSQLYVSDIACAQRDRSTAWLTYSSYGTAHVWKTTDLGATWKPQWQGMPDIPVNSIVLHPDNDDVAFVGTDIGVFATFNGGQTWEPYGKGLPRSPVLDLRADATFSYLRAATHGRSAWEVPLVSVLPTEPAIVTPTGGERFAVLSSIVVQWTGFTGQVDLSLSTDDGFSWQPIAQEPGSALRITLPNTPTPYGRVRVQSATTNIVSKSFAIVPVERGLVISQKAMSWTPYGLAWDGKDGLWTTDIHSSRLYKLQRDTLTVMKTVQMMNVGDSLFTDLTFDRDSGLIYVHRLDNLDGTSTTVFVLDTNGNVRRSFPSQARRYGTGLELMGPDLIGVERDGQQRTVAMDPITGALRSSTSNPFRSQFGPRCFAADGLGNIIQVCTGFPPGGGKLSNVIAAEIPRSNLGLISDQLILEYRDGLINARGIEIDQRDQTMWVSDIDGVIWKIAGMNVVPPTTSVSDNAKQSTEALVTIAPHPVRTFALITLLATDHDRTMNIRICDVAGRTVHTIPPTSQTSGEPLTVRLHAGTLLPGMYLLLASSVGDADISRTFIIAP